MYYTIVSGITIFFKFMLNKVRNLHKNRKEKSYQHRREKKSKAQNQTNHSLKSLLIPQNQALAISR